MKIFTLIRTDYEDDYKHRYDSGVYVSVHGTYSTIGKAYEEEEKDKRVTLLNYCDDHYIDEETEYLKYFTYDKESEGDHTYYNNFKFKDDVDIDDLCEIMLKGEFVEYCTVWNIEERKLE